MRLLVATDGSDPAERALDYALDLAEADRLFVIDSVADAEERGDALLSEAAETAADRGMTVETELLYGDPTARIPGFAESGGFDGVILGHRGLSERVEELMGSVAKELVSLSDVPVTVVP